MVYYLPLFGNDSINGFYIIFHCSAKLRHLQYCNHMMLTSNIRCWCVCSYSHRLRTEVAFPINIGCRECHTLDVSLAVFKAICSCCVIQWGNTTDSWTTAVCKWGEAWIAAMMHLKWQSLVQWTILFYVKVPFTLRNITRGFKISMFSISVLCE